MTFHSDTRRGVLYMVAASFLFALTVTFAKLLSASMGSVEVTFWRNAVGLILLLGLVLRRPIRNAGGRPWTLVFRGVVGTVALLAFFYTVSATTLSNAIVYSKTEPIFTALIAFFVLREKLSGAALLAVGIGFAGVVLLSWEALGYLHLMGILTGFLSALAYTSVRSLKAHYDERTVVLSFMIAGVVIPAAFMILAEYYTCEPLAFALSPFVMPGRNDWLWIVLMGISAAFGQLLMTRAYFYARAGIVSTASYSVVLFATGLGIVLGDALPTATVLAGGGLIVLSGVLLTRSKHP